MNLKEEVEKILEYVYSCEVRSDRQDKDKVISTAAEQILQMFEEMLPEESIPLAGSLDDKYGYLAGQRKGFNSCLTKIRERIGEK